MNRLSFAVRSLSANGAVGSYSALAESWQCGANGKKSTSKGVIKKKVKTRMPNNPFPEVRRFKSPPRNQTKDTHLGVFFV